MGELEKYGLLSVGSILVLFLIITFGGPALPGDRRTETGAGDAMLSRADSTESHYTPGGGGGALLRSSQLRRSEEPSIERETDPTPRGPANRESRSTNQAKALTSSSSPTAVAFHEVSRGETLSGIAKRYLGDPTRWQELMAVNPRLDPNRIVVGTKIAIPAQSSRAALKLGSGSASGSTTPSSREHLVVSGETLSGIASRYYGDESRWSAIYNHNRARIPAPNRLEVGTLLILP